MKEVKSWEQAGENLLRHVKSGGLYLNATISGKKIRKSLGTKSMRIAKMKRDDMLQVLRTAAGRRTQSGSGKITTGAALVGLALDYYRALPSYQKKPASLHYREQLAKVLLATLPQLALERWTNQTMFTWWGAAGVVSYSETRRNNMLGMLRKGFELAIDAGAVLSDPTAQLKRASVKSQEVKVPTREQFKAIVANIREQKKRSSVESARFVEFMAFSGCRLEEARGMEWKHISDDFLLVTGGAGGTKNHHHRRVPIIPAMVDLLAEMRAQLLKRGFK